MKKEVKKRKTKKNNFPEKEAEQLAQILISQIEFKKQKTEKRKCNYSKRSK
jgi:hypothetical protein